jgi:hypothetical protein
LNSLQTRLAHRAGNTDRQSLGKKPLESLDGARRLLRAFTLALTLMSCGRCSDQHVVSGEHAYTRCRALAPSIASEQRVGALTFRMRERTLEISGLRRPAMLAAFTGPGPGPAPSPAAFSALAAERPDLLLALGDLGDSDAVAGATVRGLAAGGIPTLLLAGARDTPERLAAALPTTAGSVMQVSSLDAIRIDSDTFVPLAGTRLGRYALADTGCGFGPDELEALAVSLGPRRADRRWLLAWGAPAGGPAASTVDAGDPELERFARAIGAAGGLFAWPSTQAGRAFAAGGQTRVLPGAASRADLQLVVPRLTPPALERADGSRSVPGYALLRLDAAGLQLVAIRELPPS